MDRKTRMIIAQMLLFFGFAISQDNAPKFRMYGFADMSIQKMFLKDDAFLRASNLFSDRLMLSFDHLNLYTDFTPNDHVRMLVELGYKRSPGYMESVTGQIVNIAGLGTDTILHAKSAPSKKKDTEYFEIERATIQLKVNQYVRLSFGKFITPAGIWNVDHGSPVIITLRQPTQFSMMELYPKSQIGIMEEGNILYPFG